MTIPMMATTIMISSSVKAAAEKAEGGRRSETGTEGGNGAKEPAGRGKRTIEIMAAASPGDVGRDGEHSGKHADQQERHTAGHNHDHNRLDHVGHDANLDG